MKKEERDAMVAGLRGAGFHRGASEIERLAAEAERLEAALQKIASGGTCHASGVTGRPCGRERIARAALPPAPGDAG